MRTKSTRRAVVGLGAGLLLLASCTKDSLTTAPAGTRTAASLSSSRDNPDSDRGGYVTTLARRERPVKAASASITLSSAQGGTLVLRDAGLQVHIPAGAIPGTARMTITVSAIPGEAMAYTFTPHGVKFNKPLVASQMVPWTLLNTLTNPLSPPPVAAYFTSTEELSLTEGRVRATELLPLVVEVNRSRVSWDISHFSGYVIASGRSAPVQDD